MLEGIIFWFERAFLAIIFAIDRFHRIELMSILSFELWILEGMIIIIVAFKLFIKLSGLKSDLGRVLNLDLVLIIKLKKLFGISLFLVLVKVVLIELNVLLLL